MKLLAASLVLSSSALLFACASEDGVDNESTPSTESSERTPTTTSNSDASKSAAATASTQPSGAPELLPSVPTSAQISNTERGSAFEAAHQANCAERETLCDGVDDDCNGRVDDVDIGSDGICDCLRIGLMGTQGLRPSANFQSWLQHRGTTVERFATTASDADFDLAKLRHFDVILLDFLQGDINSSHAEAIRQFIELGGAVVSLTGYNNSAPQEVTRHNMLLSGLGVSYVINDRFSSRTQRFAAHPVSESVTQVAFQGGNRVAIGTPPGNTTPFAWAENNALIGVAEELGLGRVVVWGDEWITFDSEWATLPGVARFWTQILAWVGPRNSCQLVTTPML